MSRYLDIVIVNWNTGDQLRQLVSSIFSYHDELVESVVIIDNASSDSSLSDIVSEAEVLPFRLQIVCNDINIGFGAACNQGAALCNSEFVLFLNPDTLLYANSLAKPLELMQRPDSHHIGIAGIQLVDEEGEISPSCSRFPTVRMFLAQALGLNRLPWFRNLSQMMSEWDHKGTRQVDQVMGAFFLVRRSLFEDLQGFDERFFVYFEEVDFALRARILGKTSVYLAEARAFHSGGGASRKVKAQRLFYSLRSRLLYGFKHFSFWQAWGLVLISLAIEPVTRTIFSAGSGCDSVINTWRGYGMLYCDLPHILRRVKIL